MDGVLTTPVPAAATPLTTFLADHDAPCPQCRYNLRGVSAPACPECGCPIELSLREPQPLASRRALLLLALLWIFALGLVQSIRSGHEVYEASLRGQFSTFTIRSISTPSGSVTFQGTTSLSTTPQSTTLTVPGAPLRATIRPTPAVRGGVSGLTPSAVVRNGASTTVTPGSGAFTVATPGPMAFSTVPSWSSVTWWEWTRSALWMIVAILGIAGLALLLVYRRRAPGPRAVRAILTLAWSGFALSIAIELQALIWSFV